MISELSESSFCSNLPGPKPRVLISWSCAPQDRWLDVASWEPSLCSPGSVGTAGMLGVRFGNLQAEMFPKARGTGEGWDVSEWL